MTPAPQSPASAGSAARSAPVKSAPFRRRKPTKPGRVAPVGTAADTSSEVVEPATVTEAPGSGTTSDAATVSVKKPVAAPAADLTKDAGPDAVTVDAGADPDTLTGELSYRERRRRRTAAAAPQPGSVARVSALRRRSDRPIGAIVAMCLSVLVIVGALVASAVFAIGTGRIEHQRDLRAEYSSFAQQMTVTMTSLNPSNVDAAMKTMSENTSGAAQQRLKDSMAQAVSLIRDQNLEVKSTVITDAVTKATETEGSVIVVYGWQMKPENPQEETIVQTFRWRVDITRINGDLKMTNFEWVT